MTRALYFDCFSGISGDMTFGALLDLGLDKKTVFAELEKLDIKGYRIDATKAVRYGISGTDLSVCLTEDAGHAQSDSGAHVHGESQSRGDSHGHRNLDDIVKIIQDSKICEGAKRMAVDIFRQVADAEGKVHSKPAQEVHFHEVGATDSIVDIVGTAICLDMLKAEVFYCSPLCDGEGFVETSHGKLPVPVPAVMQMLKESELSIKTGIAVGELITPTGMAIVKALAKKSSPLPLMNIKGVGYGFGKRDTGSLNAIRLILGDLSQDTDQNGEDLFKTATAVNTDTNGKEGDCSGNNAARQDVTSMYAQKYDIDIVSEIQTNVDDMTGEELGFLMQKLMQTGARDVFYTPVQMKKTRPGVLICVIASPDDEALLIDVLMRHSTTAGVRITRKERRKLIAQSRTVSTPFGEAGVKTFSTKDGTPVKEKLEFGDCEKLAESADTSVRKIIESYKKNH